MFSSYLFMFLSSLLIVVLLLIAVAFFTLVERKFMGAIQNRVGPDVIGFCGVLQPFADGLKLFSKETILPSSANILLFILAPIITFVVSLLGWAVIPFAEGAVLCDINIGILYLLAVSSLSVYGVICGGWSSNSKYPFLGALRSAAQMVSYEISIGFILVTVIICTGSFNLTEIVKAQNDIFLFLPLFPVFLMFIISALAETNRHPFDLPEAEAELVSGYNVEYSAMAFALFFLGEYANMLLMSSMAVIFFCGGWLPIISFSSFIFEPFWFSIKISFFVLFFIWARAALPRYRYDQLMSLGWKTFLPFSLSWLVFTSGILISFNFLAE
jgi:NADH-quinone oxidoreductase subunit H